MRNFQKTKMKTKKHTHKKFNLEEIQKNNPFYKYIGCWEDDPAFEGLTSVQIAKKWTDYVD